MSGGHFDYLQFRIEDIARQIDELCLGGDGHSQNVIEKFKEAAHTLRQSADMAQRVDWLVSGDDGEETFFSRWNEEVRPYWNEAQKLEFQKILPEEWKDRPVIDCIKDLTEDKKRLDYLGDRRQDTANVLLPKEIVSENLDSLRNAISDTMKIYPIKQ